MGEMLLNEDQTEPSDKPLTPEKLDYVRELFHYTNELFRRTENRANYLFVGNSIVAAAYFSIVGLIIDNTTGSQSNTVNFLTSASITIPAILIGISVLIATRAILPIILDAEIKLNQSFIASMSAIEYHEFLSKRDHTDMQKDFVDEIHILSKILEVKNSRLNLAMRAFLTTFLVIAIGTVAFAGLRFFA